MDSVQYMANALLMEDTNLVRIHARVYSELNRWVPQPSRDNLLGRRADAPADENASRRARANDPYRLGEFLPCFAIRPLYNQALFFVSKAGLGLVRSGILISTMSYFFLGSLLMAWLWKYAGVLFAAVIASLVMISPPLLSLGRTTTSDALATLVAFSSLYLIFEKRFLLPGLTVLLSGIYFRTDVVVLAGPVLLVCWLERRLNFWQTATLALLAVGSVFTINHFAGDYGIKMLYYREFKGTLLAPSETVVQFSGRDFFHALRSGIGLIMGSFFLPFLLVGIGGWLGSARVRTVALIAIAYAALHFLIFPGWEDRWLGIFYLTMGVAAAAGLSARNRSRFLLPFQSTSESERAA